MLINTTHKAGFRRELRIAIIGKGLDNQHGDSLTANRLSDKRTILDIVP